MPRAPIPLWALVLSGSTLLACAGAAPTSYTPSPPAPPPLPAPNLAADPPAPASPCAPSAARSVTPAARTGSSIALVDDGARRLAYVADEEGRALHTVDADVLAELAVTELPGSPAQVLPLADGRILVTLRDENRLLALEPGARPEDPLRTRCARATYTEPFGLAVSPDGARVAVTAGWDHRLTILDAGALEIARTVDLPAEPRGVLVSADGADAYVSHLAGGVVSVVSLARPDEAPTLVRARPSLPAPATKPGGKPGKAQELAAGQGFALAELSLGGDDGGRWPARVLVPMASSDPMRFTGDAGFPSVYGGGGGPAVVGAFVAVIDTAARGVLGGEVAAQRKARPEDCILPRGVAAAGDRILVTCMGTDVLVELDARAADPITAERARYGVASGPTGVAYDTVNARALVASSWGHAITVVPMGRGDARKTSVLALAQRATGALTAQEERGRRLFHAVRDVRLAFDGRACASCHPDGRADGLTWATPDGPRQTIMLAGRADRVGPFGWFGDHPRMKNHITLTLDRLGGLGLDASRADEADLDALMAYVRSMKLPSRRGALAGEGVEALRARGRELFYAEETECSTCHLGDQTDGRAHDVGTGSPHEKRRSFATPALRGVAASAPYFHDGRYATLMDLLSDPTSKMGRSAQLPEDDRRALAAYLESL
jgi:DNA-binding beta-propeller fold protein YncE/mono/diheme cytochrome c family protein